MPENHHGKDRLLAIARKMSRHLEAGVHGTEIRIHTPRQASKSDTDGWYAVLGDLGRGQPQLQVWLDRYSGNTERRLWYGFHSYPQNHLVGIAQRVGRRLLPVRTITWGEVKKRGQTWSLRDRLRREEFDVPILEKYGTHAGAYFGVFAWAIPSARTDAFLLESAAAFFESVARTSPRAKPEDETREVYPRIENRKLVRLHLQRERSRYLASERKKKDEYRCQVCLFRFSDHYGDLGETFAESHHRVPLSTLRENVRTSIDDLITVCANCHRMLHRMSGGRDDVARLKAIVRANQRRRQ